MTINDAPLEDSRDELINEKIDTGLLKKVLSTINLRLCALEIPIHPIGLAYRERLSKAVVGFKIGPAKAGQSQYTLEGLETTTLFDIALEPVESDSKIDLAYERSVAWNRGLLIGKDHQRNQDLKYLLFSIVVSATVSALMMAVILL